MTLLVKLHSDYILVWLCVIELNPHRIACGIERKKREFIINYCMKNINSQQNSQENGFDLTRELNLHFHTHINIKMQ